MWWYTSNYHEQMTMEIEKYVVVTREFNVFVMDSCGFRSGADRINESLITNILHFWSGFEGAEDPLKFIFWKMQSQMWSLIEITSNSYTSVITMEWFENKFEDWVITFPHTLI